MQVLRAFLAHTKIFYSILFCFLTCIFLLHYTIAGQAVYGDGIDYYAYLPAVYIEHNLNFSPEYHHIYNHQYNNGFPNAHTNVLEKTKLTAIGKVENIHPFGMALLLFPFFILADCIVLTAHWFGISLLRNGYSDVYQITVGIGAILYMISALYITEKTIKKEKIHIASSLSQSSWKLLVRLSVLTIFLASPLFYYGGIDVINSHFASFFIVSVFFYILFTWEGFGIRKYVYLSLLLAIATMIRIQEVLLFIPLWYWIFFVDKVSLRVIFLVMMVSVGIFFLSVSALLALWVYLYGNLFSQAYFHAAHIRSAFGSLFDSQNGIFGRTPLLLVVCIGLKKMFQELPHETRILSLYFILQGVVITWYGGWIGAAYGGRQYISTLLVFIFLTVTIFTFLFMHKKRMLIALLIVIFVSVNIIDIFAFMLLEKPQSTQQVTITRLEKIIGL